MFQNVAFRGKIAIHSKPIGSMYDIFTCICHENQRKVGKYSSPMDPMGNQFRYINIGMRNPKPPRMQPCSQGYETFWEGSKNPKLNLLLSTVSGRGEHSKLYICIIHFTRISHTYILINYTYIVGIKYRNRSKYLDPPKKKHASSNAAR